MAKAKKGCVDDLATLSELNEEIILQELQARYHEDVIYVRKFSRRWGMRCDADLFAFSIMLYGWSSRAFYKLIPYSELNTLVSIFTDICWWYSHSA